MQSNIGIYLISTIGQDKYFIKIGKSRNLTQRLKQYTTSNPLINFIDICSCSEGELNIIEILCHCFLERIGKQVNHTEWYEISKDNYEKLLQFKLTKVKKIRDFIDDYFNLCDKYNLCITNKKEKDLFELTIDDLSDLDYNEDHIPIYKIKFENAIYTNDKIMELF